MTPSYTRPVEAVSRVIKKSRPLRLLLLLHPSPDSVQRLVSLTTWLSGIHVSLVAWGGRRDAVQMSGKPSACRQPCANLEGSQDCIM